MKPYYADELVELYHGDCREVLPALDTTFAAVIADPPYGETSLQWDRWPDGWVDIASACAPTLWCFGSMRMFMEQSDEFKALKFAQDVVWEKQNGSGFTADRFRRVHEHVLQFYRGSWADLYKNPLREAYGGPRKAVRKRGQTPHTGEIGTGAYVDDGTRLVPSVVRMRNRQGKAIHPTEKPVALIELLLEYSVPRDCGVLDPFAGSGSTLDAARLSGRESVGIEADERNCELIAKRMEQDVLSLWESA